MKTKLSIGLFAILVSACCLAGSWRWTGTALSNDDWTLKCSLSGSEITVTGVTTQGSGTVIDLTDFSDAASYQIVKISDSAFMSRATITEVKLPDTVTTVAYRAFRAASSLAKITLSSNLTTVGQEAFYNCTKLATVTPLLPAGVSSIGSDAFYGAPLVGELILSSPALTTIPNNAFRTHQLTKVDLSGSGVTSIGENAFRPGTTVTLETLLLPATLQTIVKNAFYGCTKLATVTPSFPTALSSIGVGAFYGCPITGALKLESTTLTDLGEDTFRACKFSTIDLSKSVITSIGKNCFRADDQLTELKLPASLTTIAGSPFYQCTALQTIRFLSKPTIASDAFEKSLGNYQARIVYPETLSAWNDYLATDPNFVQTTEGYPFSDSCQPYGKTTVGGTKYWVAREVAAGGVFMNVETSIDDPELLTAISPACGLNEQVTLPYVSTATEFTSAANRYAQATGYTLFKNVEGQYVEVETKSGLTATIPSGTENGTYKIRWNFTDLGYPVTVACPDSFGSVALSGTKIGGDYYAAGSTVTPVETDAAGTFSHWVGVPGAAGRDRTYAFAVNAPTQLRVCFKWKKVGSTITDGDWVINVSGSDCLTIGMKPTVGANTILDLTDIDDGENWTIEAVGNDAFYGYNAITEVILPDTIRSIGDNAFRTLDKLERVVLPANLETIGEKAFMYDRALTTVTPLMPIGVRKIGESTFREVPLSGDLVLASRQLTVLTNSVFDTATLTSVDLAKSGVAVICDRAFFAQNTITNIVFSKDLQKLGSQCFLHSCKNVKSVTFLGNPPTEAVAGCMSDFGALSAKLVVPKSSEWTAFVENACVPVDLTDAEKAAFAISYPGEKVPKQKARPPFFDNYAYLCYQDKAGFGVVIR